MSDKIYSQTIFSEGINQGRRTSANIDSKFHVFPLQTESNLTQPYMTPLTQWLNLNDNIQSVMVAHPQGLYSEMERELLPTSIDITSGAMTASTRTITWTVEAADVSAGVIDRLKKYTRVKLNSTNETGTITAISGGVVTIKRDLSITNGSQSWTSGYNDATVLYLLGEAYPETANPEESIFVDPFYLQSRTQIFGDRIDYTDRMYASTTHGGLQGGNWWQTRINDMLLEGKLKKEKALWENENHFVEGTASYTQGVVWTLRNYGGTKGTYAGGHATEEEFDQFLYQLKRGEKRKTMFTGSDLMQDIEQIMKQRWGIREPVSRYSVIDGEDSVKVLEYRVFNMLLEVIWCPTFEGDMSAKGIVLDTSMVKRLDYVPDDKGSRQNRLEVIPATNGNPFKSMQTVDDTGIITVKPAVGGIFEPAS